MPLPPPPPLANATMQPTAFANMTGNPLSNGGANLGPYTNTTQAIMSAPGQVAPGPINSPQQQMPMQPQYPPGPFRLNNQEQQTDRTPFLTMQSTFTPPPIRAGGQAGSNYARGGLASYAEGGEADVEEALSDPAIREQIMQIFTANKDNPEVIAQQLLQLVMEKIQEEVSPEQLAELQTPEGQQELMVELKDGLSKLQMEMGQDAAAGPMQAGAAPATPSAPPMMARGGLASYAMGGMPMAQDAAGPMAEEPQEDLTGPAQMIADLEPDLQLAHINRAETEALSQMGELMLAQEVAARSGDTALMAAVNQLETASRREDILLAFLSQEQFQFLVENVKRPSINPQTGLPEFFFKSVFRAVSNVVKSVVNVVKDVAKSPIFQVVAPLVIDAFAPGLGQAMAGALGVSASWAPTLMGAVTGGALGALGGGGIKGALKSAAIAGITSGVSSYLMTGNNPLSGIFSGVEGGVAANPLTAGGAGSTNLTGYGSGLGLDKSTLGSQFSLPAATPPGGGDVFAGLSANANPLGTSANSITNATNSVLNSAATAPKTGGLSGLWDTAKTAAGKLIPESTMGKIALGGLALSALGSGGGGEEQPSGPGQPNLPPGFTEKLPQYNYNRNPNDFSNRNLNTYGQGRETFDPYADLRRGVQSKVGEERFFNPTYTNAENVVIDPRTGKPVAAQQDPNQPVPARRGGLMQYAMGGMPGYAQGRMVEGAGDGVSDDVPATIEGQQPALLSSGEFVVPARIVSELGAGSSAAGARRLQQMIERVNAKRVSNKDYAADTNAEKLLPA